jgi:hypothetical protein
MLCEYRLLDFQYCVPLCLGHPLGQALVSVARWGFGVWFTVAAECVVNEGVYFRICECIPASRNVTSSMLLDAVSKNHCVSPCCVPSSLLLHKFLRGASEIRSCSQYLVQGQVGEQFFQKFCCPGGGRPARQVYCPLANREAVADRADVVIQMLDIPTVVSLLRHSGPLAICRMVSVHNLLAVQSHSMWTWTHICQKIAITQPAVTDFDTFLPIVRVRRVRASVQHCSPGLVCRRPLAAAGGIVFDFAAPTGLRPSAAQMVSSDIFLCSAVTANRTILRALVAEADNCEHAEAAASCVLVWFGFHGCAF